jgi:hypothetical protein
VTDCTVDTLANAINAVANCAGNVASETTSSGNCVGDSGGYGLRHLIEYPTSRHFATECELLGSVNLRFGSVIGSLRGLRSGGRSLCFGGTGSLQFGWVLFGSAARGLLYTVRGV